MAAESMGQLGRFDEAASILLALARDKSAEVKVRLEAVEALGALGPAAATPEVLAGLQALAEDASMPQQVRKAARQALRKLESLERP